MAPAKKSQVSILIDTCVWLDVAKDFRQKPVIGALEDLIKAKIFTLIVPSVVVEEFERNKAKVAEETKRSLQSHFRLVRDAVDRFGEDRSKATTLKALDEVDHAVALKADAVDDAIRRIESLLQSATILPTTDLIKQRVTDRATAKKAPYHRDRNSVGDAILIETYAELVTANKNSKSCYALITHNIKDFSEPNGPPAASLRFGKLIPTAKVQLLGLDR
jgi:PIN domain